MPENNDRTEREPETTSPDGAPADPRRPYEAPRLVKKRSVARATLFTAMGPMGGLTMMG